MHHPQISPSQGEEGRGRLRRPGRRHRRETSGPAAVKSSRPFAVVVGERAARCGRGRGRDLRVDEATRRDRTDAVRGVCATVYQEGLGGDNVCRSSRPPSRPAHGITQDLQNSAGFSSVEVRGSKSLDFAAAIRGAGPEPEGKGGRRAWSGPAAGTLAAN